MRALKFGFASDLKSYQVAPDKTNVSTRANRSVG